MIQQQQSHSSMNYPVKNILIFNASLRTIINQINLGLIEFTELSNLRITSSNKKDVKICIIESQLTSNKTFIDVLGEYSSKFKYENKNIAGAEVDIEDFIVFIPHDEKNDNNYIVKCIPLFELILSNDIMSDESGKHSIDEKNKIWSLESEEWCLYETYS